MSFPINEVGGYGSGALGDVTAPSGSINSYARVTTVNPTYIVININAAQFGSYERFTAGTEILIHVSGTTAATYMTYLGRWCTAKIVSVTNENQLNLDTDVTNLISPEELGHYYVQAVTIAQFKNLTLGTGVTIQPYQYNMSNYYGGIVALKCSEALTFDGGHINLSSFGIPTTAASIRPKTTQETNGTTDVQKYAGWENFDTLNRFMLNVGDGAAWIVAKSVTCHADSRIGNVSTYGSAFCRGASDSVGTKPGSITNVGGSTILMAAETITNFNQRMFAKYRASTATAGQGICRCYIATETKIPNDEGLYAYDCINTPSRIIKQLNIKDYGDGNLGDLTDITVQLNNYARVTAISEDRKKLSYTGKTTSGIQQIAIGSLVMIHQNHKNSTTVADAGRFIIAKVLSDNNTEITINTPLPNEFNASTYAVQIVTIPQCNNFKLSKTNSATPKFSGTQGGIFAIAVKGHCDLTSGIINVMQKGGGNAYAANGMKEGISNSGLRDRLPIGQGHGSIFILANTLTMNANTRLGATYSGANFGGNSANNMNAGGGYKGKQDTNGYGSGGGFNGGGVCDYYGSVVAGNGGSGAGAGTFSGRSGGYGSNGTAVTGKSGGTSAGGMHGAHVVVVADTINNFNQAAISTGGGDNIGYANGRSGPGGAGYGGGGCNDRGTGGGSGWAFIYCNNAVNQNTANTTL